MVRIDSSRSTPGASPAAPAQRVRPRAIRERGIDAACIAGVPHGAGALLRQLFEAIADIAEARQTGGRVEERRVAAMRSGALNARSAIGLQHGAAALLGGAFDAARSIARGEQVQARKLRDAAIVAEAAIGVPAGFSSMLGEAYRTMARL